MGGLLEWSASSKIMEEEWISVALIIMEGRGGSQIRYLGVFVTTSNNRSSVVLVVVEGAMIVMFALIIFIANAQVVP